VTTPASYTPQCLTLRHLLAQLQLPIIIGVSGDSGSGKTTYSNGIRRLLGTDIVKSIEMDGYHREDREQRQRSGRLPLDPEANHLDLLAHHLLELKQGRPVEVPIYNHATGKFDPPVLFAPAPIIIVEGLHALYPQFQPLLDFSIYVDPDRDVKWKWKRDRDVNLRGHDVSALMAEMLQRQAAYKRWIDFQKTNATVVIKLHQTQIEQFGRYEFSGEIPPGSLQVEMMLEPAPVPLPSLPLPFDLAAMLGSKQAPFLLSAVPSIYWGREVITIHIDGLLSPQTVAQLERYIVDFTGIPVEQAIPKQDYERVSSVEFAQLLIAWRFLEQVNNLLQELMASGVIEP